MDLRRDLKEQSHAGLAMLAECVEKCPDDLWTSGTHPRAFWRIALHAAFFTQLYLGQNEAAFQPWPGTRGDSRELWKLVMDDEPYQRNEVLEYIAFIDALTDPTIDSLDLDAAETGFCWY